MFPCIGVMRTLGLNANAVLAATYADMLSTARIQNTVSCAYQGLALLYILLAEEKLSVQI